MRILIAPDKFKGCLGSREVAGAIAEGVREAVPAAEIELCPMADGGEGTVDALVAATGGRLVTRTVTGPLPNMRVEAAFGLLGDGQTAVIEMAAASGLHLLRPEQYDPLATTTYGTGELIVAAIEAGARRIILGIGGSATVDGGIGCAQACGATINMHESQLSLRMAHDPPLSGGDLREVFHAGEGNSFLGDIELLVACDVDNPLYGPTGAAPVFGPQKGATPEQVQWLDDALRELATRLGADDLARRPGAGAAGGLGFGLMAFLGARLEPGFALVARAVGLEERVAQADLVLTGEGRLDASSLHGKTAIGVAALCGVRGVPCVALAGAVDGKAARSARARGLTAAFSICDGPMELSRAVAEAPGLIAGVAAQVVSVWARARA
ncbi:MAG TPA: glycerate kinase [Tepidisphaeraceae bacterium]|nr:glycerate kinase [Tepidisphaeraceae bacterium]